MPDLYLLRDVAAGDTIADVLVYIAEQDLGIADRLVVDRETLEWRNPKIDGVLSQSGGLAGRDDAGCVRRHPEATGIGLVQNRVCQHPNPTLL